MMIFEHLLELILLQIDQNNFLYYSKNSRDPINDGLPTWSQLTSIEKFNENFESQWIKILNPEEEEK